MLTPEPRKGRRDTLSRSLRSRTADIGGGGVPAAAAGCRQGKERNIMEELGSPVRLSPVTVTVTLKTFEPATKMTYNLRSRKRIRCSTPGIEISPPQQEVARTVRTSLPSLPVELLLEIFSYWSSIPISWPDSPALFPNIYLHRTRTLQALAHTCTSLRAILLLWHGRIWKPAALETSLLAVRHPLWLGNMVMKC